MLMKDATKEIALSGATFSATTKALAEYDFSARGFPFALVDTWGQTLYNFVHGELAKIVKGESPRVVFILRCIFIVRQC